MATIRPQPPGDMGSRKHLANRKSKIENVEHAYSGIVNVYALRPSGSGPISLGEFTGGKLVIPKDAILHEQPFLTKKEKKQQAINQSKVGEITYGFDKSRSAPGLYRKFNGKFIEGEGPVDALTYEQEMTRRGSTLVNHYDESDPKYKEAVRVAQYTLKKALNNQGRSEYDRKLKFYAMKFQLPISTMSQIIKEYWVEHSGALNPDKAFETIEKVSKEQLKDETDAYLMQLLEEPNYNTTTAKYIINALSSPRYGMTKEEIQNSLQKLVPSKPQISESSIPAEIREVKAYPVPIEGLRELSIIGPEYTKVSGEQLSSIASNNPSSLAFKREPNNGISYYVKITSRRKHNKNINMKRVIYRLKKPISKNKKSIVKKTIRPKIKSRSANLKQNMLNKLKCICRRKKK